MVERVELVVVPTAMATWGGGGGYVGMSTGYLCMLHAELVDMCVAAGARGAPCCLSSVSTRHRIYGQPQHTSPRGMD